MALTNPPKNWVIRYWRSGVPNPQYNFAGWKENGNPSYTSKFDKIQKFATPGEAYEVSTQLNEMPDYVAEVKKICIGYEDNYYFI
jgi:hypothetical protein